MIRLYTLILFCTIVGLVPIKQLVQKQQGNTQQHQNQTQDHEPERLSFRVNHPESATQEERTNQEAYDGLGNPVWPNWALVIVGTITIFVIGWQAVETRKAAQVAQENIKIVAGENRPWLLIELTDQGERIDTPILMQGTSPACTFYIRNYGKTPAELTVIRADLIIGRNPKEPPSNEIIEIGKRFNPRIIPQGDSLVQRAEMSVWTERDFRDAVLGTQRETEKYCWLRGVIEYKHTIRVAADRSYRTEFLFLWQTRGDYWQLIRSEAT